MSQRPPGRVLACLVLPSRRKISLGNRSSFSTGMSQEFNSMVEQEAKLSLG